MWYLTVLVDVEFLYFFLWWVFSYYGIIFYLFSALYLYLSLWIFICISVRYHVIFFFFFLILSLVWLFFYNLDGVALLFALLELVMVFVFLLFFFSSYTQLFTKRVTWRVSPFFFLFFLSALLTPIESLHLNLSSFFWYTFVNTIITGDFFLIYNFFFIQYFMCTLFLVLLISFLSVYFVYLFVFLRIGFNSVFYPTTQFHFLRRQNFIKQPTWGGILRLFN